MTEQTAENCNCLKRQKHVGEGLLEVFADIRSHCPALNRIFVPDEVWPDFQQWHRQPDTIAHHRSILLLAMERGYLGRVTSAVHRYLIAEGLPRPNVRQQYLQDLRERWMFCSDPIERNQKYRMFSGKLVELQFAEWLELQGWRVSVLEAFRKGPDIEAYASDGRATAFEVKFVGIEDDDFASILASLARQPAGRSVSLYDPVDYLLFRVYEAAKQLQQVKCDRIAVVVVEESTWQNRFEIQLSGGWFDCTNPSFFPSMTLKDFWKLSGLGILISRRIYGLPCEV